MQPSLNRKGLAKIEELQVVFELPNDLRTRVVPLFADSKVIPNKVKKINDFKTTTPHYKAEVVEVKFRGKALYGVIAFGK